MLTITSEKYIIRDHIKKTECVSITGFSDSDTCSIVSANIVPVLNINKNGIITIRETINPIATPSIISVNFIVSSV